MHSPSILIVEDDAALLRGLKDNFEAQNFRVEIARNGREGLALAVWHPPDLILLDIMLPKMNGYEVCRSVRDRKLEMPIIMLTAKGQEEDVIRGLESGADDYVTKPFSIRQLLARARAFLRRYNVSERAFTFGDFKLDLAAHKLFRNGIQITLTNKEFDLLKFFISRPGRALTRDQILDAVWGNEIIVNDRSVDRCVTTLRAKIEANPHHPAHVQTIRSIGYRFEA
jgi:DNA-binding response OmpR family regulator